MIPAQHLAQVFGIEGYFAETPDGPVFQPLAARVLDAEPSVE